MSKRFSIYPGRTWGIELGPLGLFPIRLRRLAIPWKHDMDEPFDLRNRRFGRGMELALDPEMQASVLRYRMLL